MLLDRMKEGKTELAKNVYWVGAKDPGRKSFDALVPLPLGTTYNAYLIEGSDKTALLDTVDPSKLDILLDNLEGIDKLDYIVSHHAEQDHSGSILKILERYSKAKVVTTLKGRDFLRDLIHLPEDRVLTVEDNDKLKLGGKTLRFLNIPWSHWPETMASYLIEDGILFPCDLFGSHWARAGLQETDLVLLESAAKRYYAEIMMPYATIIKRHLPKLASLKPRLIAPSHGPLFDNPAFIMDLYERWIEEPPHNLVLLPYVSMHGSTARMVSYVKEKLEKAGIKVNAYNTESYDPGEFAMDLVDAGTILFAAPTVVTGIHPLVASAAYLTNILRPKARWIGYMGSYGWGTRAALQLKNIMDETTAEFLEPALVKGLPRAEDYARLDALIAAIREKHRSLTSAPFLSPAAIK